MTEKRYRRHTAVLLGCSLALSVFVSALVTHHTDIPGKVQRYRLDLLSDGQNASDRIKPVGRMEFATAPAQAPAQPTQAAAARDGQQIYKAKCDVCHGAGIAGSPKLDDKDQWSKRLAKGLDSLYASSLNGLQSAAGVMPAKGGDPTLSDADVKAAVDYMVARLK